MVMISDNDVASETRRRPRWPGLIVPLACATSAYVLDVRGQSGMNGYSGTLYDGCRWLLLGLLVLAGVGLLMRDRFYPYAATVGAITAAQLTATGIVAAKHWRPLSGSIGYGSANLSALVLLAWVLVVAAGVATVACLVAARASGVTGRSRYRWLGLADGVVIAVVLPLVLGHGHGLRTIAVCALLYSLPWGVALAVSGWLDRGVALTALATVVVSVAGATVSHNVLPVERSSHVFVPTLVITLALAAFLISERGPVGKPAT